jgi:protein-tyrosine-phosphatase
MKNVLFVCTHNAGRSQMAQAFFDRHAPPDVRAESAGAQPARAVWPVVVRAMEEIGIDLSGERPRPASRASSRGRSPGLRSYSRIMPRAA